MMSSFSVMRAYVVKRWKVFKNSPGWMLSSGLPLKLCTVIGIDMMGGRVCGGVTRLGWAGCCKEPS
jgi:hypothetical protein